MWSWGLAAPLTVYPELSFLDDAVLVGSYIDDDDRLVYVYLIDEDGQHREFRIDEDGNILSERIVP